MIESEYKSQMLKSSMFLHSAIVVIVSATLFAQRPTFHVNSYASNEGKLPHSYPLVRFRNDYIV